MWRENEAFQGQNSYMKIFPHHPLYHIPNQQTKISFYGAKIIEGPKTPDGPQ